MEASDSVLIQRSLSGELGAFDALMARYQGLVFTVAMPCTRDREEALDICQDAFLKAFASLNTFSSEYRFSTWLFTIGYRVCLNRLRRTRGTSTEVDFNSMHSPEGTDSAEFVAS